MNTIRLLFRVFNYELRLREWYGISIAIILSTLFLTLFYIYTDRFNHAITQQSTNLLGGDLVITSSSPIPDAWKLQAQKYFLRSAEIWTIQTIATSNAQIQLIQLQAVSDSYPLLKNHKILLGSNEILAEPRLLSLLKLQPQQNIHIGNATFRIKENLSADVDSLSASFNLAPHAMIRLSELGKTKIVLPGSRINYRLIMVGDKQNLVAYRSWLKPQLSIGQRLIDVTDQQFVLSDKLITMGNIFRLILLFIILLCASSILMNTRKLVNTHQRYVALWKTFGASQIQVLGIFTILTTCIGIFAAAIGALVAIILQIPLDNLIKTVLAHELPSYAAFSIMRSIAAGAILLAIIIWQPLYRLTALSPSFIFNRQVKINDKFSLVTASFNLILLVLYIHLFLGLNNFILYVVAISLLIFALIYFLSLVIIKFITHVIPATKGSIRRGLHSIIQYADVSQLQISLLTLLIVIGAGIVLSQNRLLADLTSNFGGMRANYFVYNIAASDLPNLKKWMQSKSINTSVFYPILRARLIAINKHLIDSFTSIDKTHNALQRELNLTASSHYSKDNKILVGARVLKQNELELSLEESLAKALHAKLGDTLTFAIMDKKISAQVINIRSVEWRSLHPNFYVITTQKFFDGFNTPYLTSIYLSPANKDLIVDLVRAFPSVTIIDIAEVLEQIQVIIDFIGTILRYILLAISTAAFLLLWSFFSASKPERIQTQKLLIILGASKSFNFYSRLVHGATLLIIIMLLAIPASFLLYYYVILHSIAS